VNKGWERGLNKDKNMTKEKEYLSPMPISTEIVLFVKKERNIKEIK